MAAEPFQYAILRVIPRIERGECLNVGVLLYCRTRRYLAARIELDPVRLANLDPDAPVAAIERQLTRIGLIVSGGPEAGAIAALSQSERFGWLTAPSSTIIQSSPTHSGVCEEPAQMLERLFRRLVA